MLFRKAELDKAVTQQQLADRVAAIQKIKQNATNEIAERDSQIAKANSLLDREQRNAQSLDQQIALINQLVQLPHQIKSEVAQAVTPPDTEGVKPGLVIQASDVPVLLDHEVSCKKCENDLVGAKDDLLTTQTVVQQQDVLLQDYKNEFAHQPHTRWQRFHTGLKWVFSLGASKH
jgi:hypothetical protein